MSKYNILRHLAYTIEILILFIIEQTPYLMGNISGIKPVFIVSVAIVIAMFEKNTIGLSFGIFTGLLMDVGSGDIFGFNILFMSVLCYAVNLLATEFIKTNILTAILTSIICVFIVFSAQFVFLYVMMGYDEQTYAYMSHYLPIILCSAVPAPLAYLLNKFLFVFLNERE